MSFPTPLKVEIKGKQAKVYWNDTEEPVMIITNLMHGSGKGGIMLSHGPGTAEVYFSNFQYRCSDELDFEDPPKIEMPEGIIMDWEVSKAYPAGEIDVGSMKYPFESSQPPPIPFLTVTSFIDPSLSTMNSINTFPSIPIPLACAGYLNFFPIYS